MKDIGFIILQIKEINMTLNNKVNGSPPTKKIEQAFNAIPYVCTLEDRLLSGGLVNGAIDRRPAKTQGLVDTTNFLQQKPR